MVTMVPQIDVICLAIPEDLDLSTDAGRTRALAELGPLVPASVWAQWSPGHAPMSMYTNSSLHTIVLPAWLATTKPSHSFESILIDG